MFSTATKYSWLDARSFVPNINAVQHVQVAKCINDH